MIKGIIFDCFGVLVGSGFWNIYRRAGGDPAKDKQFIDDWLHKNSLGQVTSQELTTAIAAQLGLSVADWQKHLDDDEKPNLDLFDFIRDQLKGRYRLSIVSNAYVGAIERKIPPELLALFDDKIVSAEVGIDKPDPAIFSLAAERLGLPPADIVCIDDHQAYLDGAASLGMRTVLYEDFHSFTEQWRRMMAGDEGSIGQA